MKTVLTIAGSDTIGGAGVQADIKAISAKGCYGMSVITSLTAQNTLGVNEILNVPAEFVTKQLEAVFDDIVPDAVKIGMLSDKAIIDAVAKFLENHRVKNIVLDTVMVSTSGCPLIDEGAMEALTSKLFALADMVTPNIPEAQILANMTINSPEDMYEAAKIIMKYKCKSVLIKGGHLESAAMDILYDGKKFESFSNKIIANPNTHGTGCTLSSAIAAELAKGNSPVDSVRSAKAYVTGAIADGLNLGKGRGPLNHFYNLFG